MRFFIQFRFLLIILSLLISQLSFATPVRTDVTGILKTGGTDSPYPKESVINGWYELDWDNPVYEYEWGGRDYYSGILNYEFTVDNKFHIRSFPSDLTYYLAFEGDAPIPHAAMSFYSRSPWSDSDSVPIDYLDFWLGGTPAIKLSFETDEIEGRYYYGDAELHVVKDIEAPEPGALMLLLLGIVSIFCARFKFRSHC